MVTVTAFAQRVSKEGKEFITLEISGGLEMVQSMETGNFYGTVRKCSIPCTFSEKTAAALIGSQIPGEVVRVEAEPYDYTIKETGEVIKLNYKYDYRPEGHKEAVKAPQMVVS